MPVMVVVPELANEYGLHEALVLRQLHYWLGRATIFEQGTPWVYKTVSEWSEEFTWWSRSTVHKLLADLAGDNLITIRPADGRTYYTINYEKLTPSCRGALLMLSEIRTEDTPEASENRTDEPPKTVMLSENRTVASENRTELSEFRTAHNKEVTEITTETTAEGESARAASPPAAVLEAQQAVYREMCKALGRDRKTIPKWEQQEIAEAATKLVDAEYTAGDIGRFLPEVWAHDWRWTKRKEFPKLEQLMQEIGKLRADLPEVMFYTNGAGPPAQSAGEAAVDSFFARLADKDHKHGH